MAEGAGWTMTGQALERLAGEIHEFKWVYRARAWTRVEGKERVYVELWQQDKLRQEPLVVHADGRGKPPRRWCGSRTRGLHGDETIPAIEALVEELRPRDAQEAAEWSHERESWITKHGSLHLRRLADEGMEHDDTYREERLTLERPDWRYLGDSLPGRIEDPQSPPPSALALLDEARATADDAKLAAWRSSPSHGNGAAGCTCVATYLGRSIVYRIAADGTPPLIDPSGDEPEQGSRAQASRLDGR